MLLKNKKTGEIVDITMPIKNSDGGNISSNSLAELNAEWEDASGWEVGSIKSKLAKIEVASQDYYEDKKTEFTWDEAMAIEKKLSDGWRLPTRSEWCLLCEEFGQDENGELDPKELNKNLNMKPSGGIGLWWSSTELSGIDAYDLAVYTSSIYPQNNNLKGNPLALRFVRDLGGKE